MDIAAQAPDWDEELFVLNYATRLFLAITDKKALIQTALETFADFSRTQQVGIMLVDESRLELTEAGFYDQGVTTFPDRTFHLAKNSPEHELILSHEIQTCPEDVEFFPRTEKKPSGQDQCQCLCVPVACSSKAIRALIILTISDHPPDFETLQRLRVLSSVFALSLENMLLFEMAVFDGLTKVHVRRYFEIRANEEMAKMKRTPQHLGIILMDIDDFKAVNDCFGHMVGDHVLIEFAGTISQGLRQNIDIVCRYGGDEFVILLPQTDPKETKNVAQRILDRVNSHSFAALPPGHDLSFSAGAICIGPDEHIPLQSLIHRVDTLLYMGKKSGGNTVVTAWEDQPAELKPC
jgi:diguanylate cyclase (GGDEF)-like protein